MTRSIPVRSLALTAAVAAILAGSPTAAQAPLAIDTGRITIAGTSNVHDYTATTTTVKATRVQFAPGVAGPAFWDEVQKPHALQAFDIAIPAESLKSPKDGLDKNMYKALKTKEHPQITFRLARLDGAAGSLKAVGTLTIAGVEREITLPLTTSRREGGLAVRGAIDVLMTDYGIAPPKAMLGMVKADPKITVTFEVVLAAATT
ncbi:MAG TPA: YceI family protein [Vicinamibacterales bacterium]|nr:YceI family protein [Vicinamibacterales bacterium]